MKRGLGVAAPRIAVGGSTLAVTRRCNERKLLWTPSGPAVSNGYLWSLAKMQRAEKVEVHHACLMPNHAHETITPTAETNLGEALRLLHRESARFLQEDLLARGYDAPQAVWDKRQTHAMHLVDVGAQNEWILYEHLNVVEAGLVARVEDYPGLVTPLSLLKGGVVPVPRPEVYTSRSEPREMELVITPTPEQRRLYGEDLEGLSYWMEKAAARRERQLQREREAAGRRVIGAERLRRIHPFSEPATPRERRGRRAPRFKVGRGFEESARRALVEQLVNEDAHFQLEHAEAKQRWVEGDRNVEFPFGTLQMVTEHGAAMAEVRDGAVLCAPSRVISVPDWTPRQAVEVAASAIGDIADELEDEGPLVIVEPGEARVVGDGEGGAIHAHSVEEVRLQSPTRTADRRHPARLVTLRTRRRRRGGGEPET